jgi:hypothetical protein
MKKAFIILGASKPHIRFITEAKKAGLATFVFDKDANAPGKKYADYFFSLGTGKSQIIKRELNQYIDSFDFRGAITYSSRPEAIRSLLEITRAFNLNSFNDLCVENLLDKKKMFKLLSSKMTVPQSGTILDKKGLLKVTGQSSFPLIFKPTKSGGSENVYYIENENEAVKIYKSLQKKSSLGEVLVQNFIDGDEYCLNGYIFKGKVKLFPIAKKYTLGKRHGFTHSGFALVKKGGENQKLVKDLKATYIKAASLVGADNYFFAIDAVVSRKKVFLIDFGFLLDSKFDRLLDFSKINPYKILLDISLGQKPAFVEKSLVKKSACLNFLYAEKSGKLRVHQRINLPRNTRLEWERADGDDVHVPLSVADTLGWVISETKQMAEKQMNKYLFRIV